MTDLKRAMIKLREKRGGDKSWLEIVLGRMHKESKKDIVPKEEVTSLFYKVLKLDAINCVYIAILEAIPGKQVAVPYSDYFNGMSSLEVMSSDNPLARPCYIGSSVEFVLRNALTHSCHGCNSVIIAGVTPGYSGQLGLLCPPIPRCVYSLLSLKEKVPTGCPEKQHKHLQQLFQDAKDALLATERDCYRPQAVEYRNLGQLLFTEPGGLKLSEALSTGAEIQCKDQSSIEMLIRQSSVSLLGPDIIVLNKQDVLLLKKFIR